MNGTVYEENQMRERVLNLIHALNITQRAFAIAIGRVPQNVYGILTGERHFPRGFCADILKTYQNVNKDWLYFGDGDMFSNLPASVEIPEDTRPRLPKSGTGGHLEDYYKGEKRELCTEKPIDKDFPDYDFSLILKNNRMEPKYQRGDELFFKKNTIIEWGNDYLLDTIEGPKFKKVLDGGNIVRCVSYNKDEYPEYPIPKNLILGFYKCVGVKRVL